MEININIDLDDLKRQVERKITKSDLIEETIHDIINSNEIKELLTEQIKEIISSEKMNNILAREVQDYITDDFDISDENDIIQVLTDHISQLIRARFRDIGK